MKTKMDLTGNRYGNLVVLKEEQPYVWRGINNQRRWLCECDCGRQVIKHQSALRNPPNNVVEPRCISCYRKRLAETGSNSRRWNGHGEISGHHWRGILADAGSRNLEVTVTIEEVWQQFLAQDGICALSGMPLVFGSHFLRKETTASLDRIDSSMGYTKENIQWLHKHINLMKLNHKVEDFIELCRRVAQFAQ